MTYDVDGSLLGIPFRLEYDERNGTYLVRRLDAGTTKEFVELVESVIKFKENDPTENERFRASMQWAADYIASKDLMGSGALIGRVRSEPYPHMEILGASKPYPKKWLKVASLVRVMEAGCAKLDCSATDLEEVINKYAAAAGWGVKVNPHLSDDEEG